MQKAGITGGIGAGKTTVCRMFETLGVAVYYADDRAKWLMSHQPELRQKIVEAFGAEAYLADGNLNRARIATAVFNDPDQLKLLNSLVHPAVFADGEAWHLAQQNSPYTLKEAALLVESGSHTQLDALIVVTAPEGVRIARVMQRDGVNEAAVRARLVNQLPESDKVKLADFVIQNNGERLLLPQVLAVHRAIMTRK